MGHTGQGWRYLLGQRWHFQANRDLINSLNPVHCQRVSNWDNVIKAAVVVLILWSNGNPAWQILMAFVGDHWRVWYSVAVLHHIGLWHSVTVLLHVAHVASGRGFIFDWFCPRKSLQPRIPMIFGWILGNYNSVQAKVEWITTLLSTDTSADLSSALFSPPV